MEGRNIPLLPHWPAWMVMISLRFPTVSASVVTISGRECLPRHRPVIVQSGWKCDGQRVVSASAGEGWLTASGSKAATFVCFQGCLEQSTNYSKTRTSHIRQSAIALNTKYVLSCY
jgi:hypothetical protein